MMQPQSDLLIDRKRLKSSLAGWRAFALLLLACFAVVVASASGMVKPHGKIGGDYIAKITIEGMMLDDPDRDAMMKDLLEDEHAKAVLVSMDSPGGTTFAGEQINLQLNELRKKKPVVGVMRTLCASACYMASLGTDYVVARRGTLTGSIGVLLQSIEVSQLMDKVGVHSVTIKSGTMKDIPDLAKPMTDEERAILTATIMDSYDNFVKLIVDRRGLTNADVRKLADGRIYTGNQAVPLKLVDALGGEEEALTWLEKEKKLSPKLELREVSTHSKAETLLEQLGAYAGIKFFGRNTLGLDGLVSIWHPSAIR